MGRYWYLKKVFIYGAIVVPIYLVFIICAFTGAINTLYRGFTVDGDGLVYVGKEDKIDVYDNGEFVRTFHDRPGGYYAFTIQDGLFYIANGYSVLEMDLAGNIVEEKDSDNTRELSRLRNHRNAVVTEDATYIANEFFAYYKITKYETNGEKEVVFQSPIIDIILETVGIFGFVSTILIAVVIHFKWYIKEYEKKHRRET